MYVSEKEEVGEGFQEGRDIGCSLRLLKVWFSTRFGHQWFSLRRSSALPTITHCTDTACVLTCA